MKPLENLTLIGFSHKSIGIDALGGLHIEEDKWKARLSLLLESQLVDEVMLLSTCNRHEFYVVGKNEINQKDVSLILLLIYPSASKKWVNQKAELAQVKSGKEAVKYLFQVSSSLNSAILGEREIITQVRSAYELCNKAGLTGDLLKILIKKTIETSKEVFTKTEIANKPVSIVNLAYRQLLERGLTEDTRILMVGAGKTNAAMARQLAKHNFKNLCIYNRTEEKAIALANETGGVGHPLQNLNNHQSGFDVLITCTGATDPIITKELYASLVDDASKKVIIDMAVPGDVTKEVQEGFPATYISIEALKSIANKNLQTRAEEIDQCHQIINERLVEFNHLYKERAVELAMRSVPTQVKEIKRRAIEEVFQKELANLDPKSADVLNKMVAYMEKKYMSLPMQMAKEILLEKTA